MPARALHLHTYFLFPFSVDKEAVRLGHSDLFTKHRRWLDGLDDWIRTQRVAGSGELVEQLGPWQRSAFSHFDFDSLAYQDMVFFHPFMRRAFFDTQSSTTARDEGLLRCYRLEAPGGAKLLFEACDTHGGWASLELTDLRLFMFANGMGILSFGVEACDMAMADVLWINESMRKIYPSSKRQVADGRTPCNLMLMLERGESREIVVEERELAEHAEMKGVLPPLAKTITAALYFLDYEGGEFEPVLDERMVVYSYVAVDPRTVPADYIGSEEYQVLLSRILFVDRDGEDYRYQPEFTREAMRKHLYTRWAHQGTYFGFTGYSNVTVTVGTIYRDRHSSGALALVHSMFETKRYMMALVALFYRATLLDFAERTALVSKLLYWDQWDGELDVENIKVTEGLRAEFLHFSSHWYFTELANKEEESEHFDLQCRQYRTEAIHREVSEELDALNASLHNYHQFRNTEGLNRLGMLSMILGGGAVVTGFFGMNLQIGPFTEGLLKGVPAYVGIAVAGLTSFGALLFGLFVIISNWSDYRDTLEPRRWRAPRVRQRLLKRHLMNQLK